MWSKAASSKAQVFAKKIILPEIHPTNKEQLKQKN